MRSSEAESLTFFLLLWLSGCLVLEGGVPCLVHGVAGAKYGGQSRAGKVVWWALIAVISTDIFMYVYVP